MKYTRKRPRLPYGGRKSTSSYVHQSNPMDEYRQPSARHDDYKPHRERETPTQFRNEDIGRVYDRSIERVRRALDNYESERRQREDEDSKQKTSEGSESNKTETTPDLIEELNKGDC